jgi:hypothetical protein
MRSEHHVRYALMIQDPKTIEALKSTDAEELTDLKLVGHRVALSIDDRVAVTQERHQEDCAVSAPVPSGLCRFMSSVGGEVAKS